MTFEDLKVTEWNAEEPVLYDLYYETASGCVKERIGFKTVEIQDDVFLVNGRKIKFHGVNHHDTSPTNGYTMTPDEIERDIQVCKDFNIDTIRTSHYPPDPLLLELADEAGIYIVDENDLETHGTFAHQLPPPPITPSATTPSGKPTTWTASPSSISGTRCTVTLPSSCGAWATRRVATPIRTPCMTI